MKMTLARFTTAPSVSAKLAARARNAAKSKIKILVRYVLILYREEEMRFSGLSVRQLEAFEATMVAGSVSGAAIALNVSQPSVSRLLQELEIDTGLSLFDRSHGRLVPTEQGLLFYGEVGKTFHGARNLIMAAQEDQGTEARRRAHRHAGGDVLQHRAGCDPAASDAPSGGKDHHRGAQLDGDRLLRRLAPDRRRPGGRGRFFPGRQMRRHFRTQ
ncbi:LysR family transcriptional regulator [Mesorhizobium sp. WSM4887]|uniref:LysR family transcriptional regulator n=1 Tax=Mesorhizobium sp. WSM4887 TaxID=3038543 RepID=UPI0024177CF4|nr:LysR family transcriptional regulator [Mesorhizobium sp. WSM4887]